MIYLAGAFTSLMSAMNFALFAAYHESIALGAGVFCALISVYVFLVASRH